MHVKGGGLSRRAFTLDLRGAFLLFRDSVSEKDNQLRVDQVPVLASFCPFLGNIHHGQIKHLEQAVVRWKNGLGFCHFSELTIKAFNSVCSINQPAHFLRVFEIGTEIRPIISPGLRNFGYFLSQCSEKVSKAFKAVCSSTAA